MPLTIVQPGVGGTGLSTGTPLSSTTAPATNPATGTPSASTYLRGDGTWASIASTSPGGSTTQVQYNNAGAFGGDSGFVYTGGNVGIGTSSPNGSLTVSKQTTALSGTGNTYGLHLYPTSSGAVYIDSLTNSTSNTSLYIRTYNNNVYNEMITSVGGNYTYLQTAGSERMRIDSSGNVGIGTSSPFRLLCVGTLGTTVSPTINIGGSSTSTATIEFGKGTSGTQVFDGYIQYTQSNSAMAFGTNGGNERGRFDSSGNFLFNSGYGSVATAYGCRAWVSFDGRNTPSIRGSGNVSSITDDGTGRFRVNFTTAMPDANYSAVATGRAPGTVTAITQLFSDSSGAVYSTTQFSLSFYSASDGYIDPSIFNAVVVR